MKDRALAFGAAGFGILAIGGLFFFSRHKNSLAPSVVSQTIVRSGELGKGFDKISALHVPCFQIVVEPSPELKRIAETGNSWEYRVVDSSGRIYLSRINADEKTRILNVPLAYGRPVVQPRLEVWLDEELKASTPLDAMPLPTVHALEAMPTSQMRVRHVPAAVAARGIAGATQEEGDSRFEEGGIEFNPRAPLPQGEYWKVEVLRTPMQDGLRLEVGNSWMRSPLQVNLPFGNDVNAVAVRATRYRWHNDSERVTLHGLSFAKEDGNTILKWASDRIPNHLGVDLRLMAAVPPYDNPSEAMSPGRRFLPTASASLRTLLRHSSGAPIRRATAARPPKSSPSSRRRWDPRSPVIDVRAIPFPGTMPPEGQFDGVGFEFDTKEIQALHLQRLTLGFSSWVAPSGSGLAVPARGSSPPPLPQGTFDLHVKVRKSWFEPVESFTTTLPVVDGP